MPIPISGPGTVDLSLWVRKLTDNKAIAFPSVLPLSLKASSFKPARTFGLDLGFKI